MVCQATEEESLPKYLPSAHNNETRSSKKITVPFLIFTTYPSFGSNSCAGRKHHQAKSKAPTKNAKKLKLRNNRTIEACPTHADKPALAKPNISIKPIGFKSFLCCPSQGRPTKKKSKNSKTCNNG